MIEKVFQTSNACEGPSRLLPNPPPMILVSVIVVRWNIEQMSILTVDKICKNIHYTPSISWILTGLKNKFKFSKFGLIEI